MFYKKKQKKNYLIFLYFYIFKFFLFFISFYNFFVFCGYVTFTIQRAISEAGSGDRAGSSSRVPVPKFGWRCIGRR